MLAKGCEGKEVRELQQLLKFHGFLLGSEIDGIFGPKTEMVVRQFQAANDLKVDGIVGPRTWNELRVAQRIDPLVANDRSELLAFINALGEGPTKRVLLYAINDLNKREDPSGSNSGDAIKHLVHNPFKSTQTYPQYWKWSDQTAQYPPWCALAVSAWIALGVPATHWGDEEPPSDHPKVQPHPFPKWFGSVAQIEDWAKDNKVFFKRTKFKDPWPSGVIFTMARTGSGSDPATSIRNGHTGLVVADDGDYVLTIEGNTSNAVKHKRRRKSTLRGFVTWWEML